MKNQDLLKIIKELPSDIELDWDGEFTARIITDDHIFECQYVRHKDWFDKGSFSIDKGIICDADEGKEIEITAFQSQIICELFRPLLHDADEKGVFDFERIRDQIKVPN